MDFRGTQAFWLLEGAITPGRSTLKLLVPGVRAGEFDGRQLADSFRSDWGASDRHRLQLPREFDHHNGFT